MPTTSLHGVEESSRSARRRGLAGAVAVLPAIVPLGIALGVALGAMSSPTVLTWSSAPLLVAGASQLVLFSQLDSGAGFLAAGAGAVMLNSRFVVYGAALSARFGPAQPRWFRLVGPHFIVDQTYAMTLRGTTDADDHHDFRHYFATAGVVLWVAWSCSVGFGVLAGPVLPPQLPLEFVLSATFVALLVPGLSARRELAAVLAGVAVALAGIGSTVTLGLAALVGWAIGASAGERA
jgi:predicted branched-subunit amino acid permease